MTESRELRAIDAYLLASGVAHRRTRNGGCRPAGTRTNAGNISRHAHEGTDGCSLAGDYAGPRPSWDSDELAAIFFALLEVEDQLHELIYAGPQVGFNIKAGRRVPKYAKDDHHDHVHVSVNRGTFIVWPRPIDPTYLKEALMVAKNQADAEAATIRWCYLTFLKREPESPAVLENWRGWLREHGLDALMWAIADSEEAQKVRNAERAIIGLQPA